MKINPKEFPGIPEGQYAHVLAVFEYEEQYHIVAQLCAKSQDEAAKDLELPEIELAKDLALEYQLIQLDPDNKVAVACNTLDNYDVLRDLIANGKCVYPAGFLEAKTHTSCPNHEVKTHKAHSTHAASEESTAANFMSSGLHWLRKSYHNGNLFKAGIVMALAGGVGLFAYKNSSAVQEGVSETLDHTNAPQGPTV